MSTSITSKQALCQFVAALSSKQPTPGGGAAAAVGAAIGASAANMSAMYTQRKKDKESGAKEKADMLIASFDLEKVLAIADEDAAAYNDLQQTWKATDMSPEEKSRIEARALAVPVKLLEICHEYILNINQFLPHCNPNIKSDAKVGIHQLAGASRAAYQTALVNSPSDDEKERMKLLLKEISVIESTLIDI